jgi:hypothetical protein
VTESELLGQTATRKSDDMPSAPGAHPSTDHGLDVLLAVRASVAPELPEELLRHCYAIQKQFQFDRDEQLPIVHTRRLVEGFVEREAAEWSRGPGEDHA